MRAGGANPSTMDAWAWYHCLGCRLFTRAPFKRAISAAPAHTGGTAAYHFNGVVSAALAHAGTAELARVKGASW